jgi:hypothetical protein
VDSPAISNYTANIDHVTVGLLVFSLLKRGGTPILLQNVFALSEIRSSLATQALTTMPEFRNPYSTGPIVEVSVLPTGWLYLPDTWIFSDGMPGLKHWSPDLSFLLQHPSGKKVLFDLGMRKVNSPFSIVLKIN